MGRSTITVILFFAAGLHQVTSGECREEEMNHVYRIDTQECHYLHHNKLLPAAIATQVKGPCLVHFLEEWVIQKLGARNNHGFLLTSIP